jgi:hypothetical protein
MYLSYMTTPPKVFGDLAPTQPPLNGIEGLTSNVRAALREPDFFSIALVGPSKAMARLGTKAPPPTKAQSHGEGEQEHAKSVDKKTLTHEELGMIGDMLVMCGESINLEMFLGRISALTEQVTHLLSPTPGTTTMCGMPCGLPGKRGHCCATCRLELQAALKKIYHHPSHELALLMRLAFEVLFHVIRIKDIEAGTWVTPRQGCRNKEHKDAVVYLGDRAIWSFEQRKVKHRWWVERKRVAGRRLDWLPLKANQLPKDTYEKAPL